MGASASRTNNTTKQTIISESAFNMINQNLSNVSAESVNNSTKSCTSNVSSGNIVDVSGCQVGGSLFLGGKQKNMVTVDFNCVQHSNVSNVVAQSILDNLNTMISNGLTSAAEANMNSYAEAQTKSGFLSMPLQVALADTSNTVDLTTKTTNNTDIQNIIQNVLKINFNNTDVQNCVNTVHTQNSQLAKDCKVSGDVQTGDVVQDNTINSVAECIQNSVLSSTVETELKRGLGIVVENDASFATNTKLNGNSGAGTNSSGIFESLGNMWKSIFSGIGVTGSVVSSIVSIVLIIGLIIISVVFLRSGGTEAVGTYMNKDGSSGSDTAFPTGNTGTSGTP